jgi:protein gp37
MQKTKIDWADYVFNPIKGICPIDCKTPDGKSYCYARRIYERFKLDPTPRLDAIEMCNMQNTGAIDKRIFVCSTFDLFHPIVDNWRAAILETIKYCKKNIFIILTKLPERIDRPVPDNVWLGVSVESAKEWHRARTLACFTGAKKKFISFEPMLGPVDEEEFPYVAGEFDWFVVGRLTGHGKKGDPAREWIKQILDIAKFFNRPVFMKSNLQEIWDAPLIQEWPK